MIRHVHKEFQLFFQRLYGTGSDPAAEDQIPVQYYNYRADRACRCLPQDEIFSSYLKDLVESYRQDVATWPDKGNYNDSRNMLHCYEYFNHYKEFIACLVQTGLGHLLLQALDSYILDTYYTEDKGQDFYYTLRAFSGSLYNIYVTWILEDSKESAEEIVSIICKIYS